MKTLLPLVIALGAIAAPSLFAAVDIDTNPYRIAMSHDGNAHDDDDIGALPMSMAIISEAGLASRVVHIEHSNHHWNDHEQDVSSQPQKMIDSASGAASRWGYSTSIIYNCRTQLSSARTSLKNAINASTASDPLFIGAAGPMDTVYDAINASTSSARTHVTVVSHSSWNNKHTHSSGQTWTDVKNSGVKTTLIIDQNTSNGDNDLNTPKSKWYWLRDSANERDSWLYGRNQASSFDVSDAGIYYYIITGRGDNKGGPTKVKDIFDGNIN